MEHGDVKSLIAAAVGSYAEDGTCDTDAVDAALETPPPTSAHNLVPGPGICRGSATPVLGGLVGPGFPGNGSFSGGFAEPAAGMTADETVAALRRDIAGFRRRGGLPRGWRVSVRADDARGDGRSAWPPRIIVGIHPEGSTPAFRASKPGDMTTPGTVARIVGDAHDAAADRYWFARWVELHGALSPTDAARSAVASLALIASSYASAGWSGWRIRSDGLEPEVSIVTPAHAGTIIW